MGHSAGCQFRVRGGHGRRAGGLSQATRPGPSHRVPGRDIETTDRRDTRADRGEAGTGSAVRL
jgi:hypothetical protein